MITNDAARTAALLAGDVDFIDQVADQRPRSACAATSGWRCRR